jgi:hypothetical protein
MSNTDARASDNHGSTHDGIMSTEMPSDLASSPLLCLSYGYQDQGAEWSLPIETIASAFSCHQ